MKPIKAKKILFSVTHDGEVELVYGPIRVLVCDSVEEFGVFRRDLFRRLNTFNDEIVQNYIDVGG